MVRLIYADALKAKIRDTAAEGTIADYCKRVMAECLDNDAPTIPAIPVEWLEDKELDYRTTGDKMFSDAFAVVIGEWQKEQEAQDG